MPTYKEIMEAQQRAPQAQEQQQAPQVIPTYRDLYKTTPQGNQPRTDLQNATDYASPNNPVPTYQEWYKKNNNNHPQGFEHAGQAQLRLEENQKYIDAYNNNELSYDDMLMKTYGYDYLQSQGHDVLSPHYWYKKFKNMDFFNPLDNELIYQQTLANAEQQLSEQGLDLAIYSNNSLFNEYVGNTLATNESMADMFGEEWEQIKDEFEGDVEESLRYYQSSAPENRFSEDGEYYVHSDGRVYRVTQDKNDNSDDAVYVEYKEDGTISHLSINKNEVTGNVFIDNTISGFGGFFIDLGKTASQIVSAVGDVGEGIVTGDWEFDKVIDTGLKFEAFRNSSPLLAKAYQDMDGFNSLTDFADVIGDFTGMALGMYATAGLGTLAAGAGQTIASTGSLGARVVGNTMKWAGKVAATTSNIHSGGWSAGLSGFKGRLAFAATHATKDALSVFTNRSLGGASQAEALGDAAKILTLNTMITTAIGSGAKDDTFHFYRNLTTHKGAYTTFMAGQAKGFMNSARTAGMITAGLDFFDNFLTMSFASSMEQTGELKADFTDVRTLIFSGLMASNAYRGAQRYNMEVPKTSFNNTVTKLFDDIKDQKQKAAGNAQKIEALNTLELRMRQDLADVTTAGDGPDVFLERVHQRMKDQKGNSIVSRLYKETVNTEAVRHAQDIFKAANELNDKYKQLTWKNAMSVILDEGPRGFIRKVLGKQGMREMEYESTMASAKAIMGINKLNLDTMHDLFSGIRNSQLDISKHLRLSDTMKGYDKASNEYILAPTKDYGKNQANREYKAVFAMLDTMAEAEGIPFVRKDDSTGEYRIKSNELETVSALQTLNAAVTVLREIHSDADIKSKAKKIESLARVFWGDAEDAYRVGRKGDQAVTIMRQAIELGYLTETQALQIIKTFKPNQFQNKSDALYKAMMIQKDIEAGIKVNPATLENEVVQILKPIYPQLEEVVKRVRLPFQRNLIEVLLEGEEASEEIKSITARLKKPTIGKDIGETLENYTGLFTMGKDAALKQLEDDGWIKKSGSTWLLTNQRTQRQAIEHLARNHPDMFSDMFTPKFLVEDFFIKAKDLYNMTELQRVQPGYIRVNLHEINGAVINRLINRVNAYQNNLAFKDTSLVKFLAGEFKVSQPAILARLEKEIVAHQILLARYPEGYIDIDKSQPSSYKLLEELGYHDIQKYTDSIINIPGIINGDAPTHRIQVGEYNNILAEIEPIKEEQVRYMDPVAKAEPVFFTASTEIDPVFYLPLGNRLTDYEFRSQYTLKNFINMKLATAGSKGKYEAGITVQGINRKIQPDVKLQTTVALFEIIDVMSMDGPDTLGPTRVPLVRGKNSLTKLRKYWANVTPVKRNGRTYAYDVSGLKADDVKQLIVDGQFKMQEMIIMDEQYANEPFSMPPLSQAGLRPIIDVASDVNTGRNFWTQLNKIVNEDTRMLIDEAGVGFFKGYNYYNEDITAPLELKSTRVGDMIKELRTIPGKRAELMREYLTINYRTGNAYTTRDKVMTDVDLLQYLRNPDNLNKGAIKNYLQSRKRIAPENIEIEAFRNADNRAMHRYTNKEITEIMDMVPVLREELYDQYHLLNVNDTAEAQASRLIQNGSIGLDDLARQPKEVIDALTSKVLTDKGDIDKINKAMDLLRETYEHTYPEDYKQVMGERVLIPGVNFPSIIGKAGFTIGEIDKVQDTLIKMAEANAVRKANKEKVVRLYQGKVIEEAMMNTNVADVVADPHLKIKYEIEKQQFMDKYPGLNTAAKEAIWSEFKSKERVRYLFLDDKGNIIRQLTAYGNNDTDLYHIIGDQRNAGYLANAKKIVTFSTNKTSVFEGTVTAIKNLDDNLEDGMTIRQYMEGKTATDFASYRSRNQHLPIEEAGRAFLETRRSRQRQFNTMIHNLADGDIQQIDGLKEMYRIFQDTQPEFTKGEEGNANFVINEALGVDMDNFYGFDAFEQIINGVRRAGLTDDQLSDVRRVQEIVEQEMDSFSTKDEQEMVAREVSRVLSNLKNETIPGKSKADFDKSVIDKLEGSTRKAKVDKFKKIVLGEVIRQSDSANAIRWALDDKYSLTRANANKNITFRLGQASRLIDQDVAFVDFEFINLNGTYYPISGGLVWGRYEYDANGKLVFNEAAESKHYKERQPDGYVFRISETDEIKLEFERIIAEMVKNGEDATGLIREYNTAIKAESDDKEGFIQRINSLKESHQLIAHNGSNADFNLMEAALGIKGLNKIDSIDLIAKSQLSNKVIRKGSLSMKALKEKMNIADIDGKSHSAQYDTEQLVKVVREVLDAEKLHQATGGKMITDAEAVLKSFGLTEKDAEYSDYFLKKKVNFDKQKKSLGIKNGFKELFGMGRNLDTLVNIQRMKDYYDTELNRYHMTDKIATEMERSMKISKTAQENIRTYGVDHLHKVIAYLRRGVTAGDNYLASKKIVDNIYQAIKSAGMTPKDLEDALFNPHTFTDDVLRNIGITDIKQYRDYKPSWDDIQDIFFDENDIRYINDRNAAANSFNASNNKVLNNIYNFIGESAIRGYQRYKDTVRLSTENGDIDVKDSIDLFSRNYNTKLNNAYNVAMGDLLNDLVLRQHRSNGSWLNAGRMELTHVHDVIGEGKRVGRANEIIIDRAKATEIFGDDWEQNPTELYGYIIPYPSDNEASAMAMKFAVVEGDMKENFLMDENLAFTLQRDHDGDKLSIVASRDQNKSAFLKQLNEVYTSPFVKLREDLEFELSKRTEPFVNESKSFETTIKLLDEYDSIRGMTPEEAKTYIKDFMMKEYKVATEDDIDEVYDRIKHKSIPAKEEVARKVRATTQDSIFGVANKDTEGVLESVTNLWNTIDETNLLSRTVRRNYVATKSTTKLMNELGMDPSRYAHDRILEFNKMITDPDRNKAAWDAMNKPGVSQQSRVNEALTKIDKLTELIPDIDRQIFIKSNQGVDEAMVLDWVRNRTGMDPELDINYDIVEKANFTNQVKSVKVALVNGFGPDTIAFHPDFANKIQQTKTTTVVRKDGQRFADWITSKKFDVGQDIDKLSVLVVRHMAEGVENVAKNNIQNLAAQLENIDYDILKSNLQISIDNAVQGKYGQARNIIENGAIGLTWFKDSVMEEIALISAVYTDGKRTATLEDNLKDPAVLKAYNKISKAMIGTSYSSQAGAEFVRGYVAKLNMSKPKELYVFKGMPIFEGTDTVRANQNGFIDVSNPNRIVINNQYGMDLLGNKVTLAGTAAGKAMTSISKVDGNVDAVMDIGDFIKGNKVTEEQLEDFKLLSSEDVTIDGRKFSGNTVVEVPMYFIENINAYKDKARQSTSRIVNNQGVTYDYMAFLSNLRSAFGFAEYNSTDIGKILNTVESQKKQVVRQSDRSLDFANLKAQVAWKLLTPEEQARVPWRDTFNTYQDMGDLLLGLEKKILSVIPEESIAQLAERAETQFADKGQGKQTKQMIKKLLAYDSKNLYSTEETERFYEDGGIKSKSSPEKPKSSVMAKGTATSLAEEVRVGYLPTNLRYMDSTEYYDILGLRYDQNADWDAVRTGVADIGKHNKGSVKSNFRISDPEMDKYIDINHGVDAHLDPKNGLGIDQAHDVIRSVSQIDPSRYYELVNQEERTLPSSDLIEMDYDDMMRGRVNRSLHAANQMVKHGQQRNPLLADAVASAIPKKLVDSKEYEYSSLNIDEYKGKMVTAGMLTKTDVEVDLRKGERPRAVLPQSHYKLGTDTKIKATLPEPGKITKVEMLKLDPALFEAKLLEDNKLYAPLLRIGDEFSDPVVSAFNRDHAINSADNLGKEFKKSLLSSAGIRRVRGGNADELAYLTNEAINNFHKNRNYIHGTMREKLQTLQAALQYHGKQAQADFNMYYAYDAALAYVKSGGTLGDATVKELQKITGKQTVKDILDVAEAYTKEYALTNHAVVDTLNEVVSSSLELGREAAILNGEPNPEMFFLLYPGYMKGDFDKKVKRAFDGDKYDAISDIRRMMGVDPIESFDKMTGEIAKIKATQILSEDLKRLGLIGNDTTVDDAIEFVTMKYNEATEADQKKINDSFYYIEQEIISNAGSAAGIYKSAYDSQIKAGKTPFESAVLAAKEFTKLNQTKAASVISAKYPELQKHLATLEGIEKIRGLNDDPSLTKPLNDLQFAYMFEAEVYASVMKQVNTDGFEEFIKSKRGQDFSIVDEYGRLIGPHGVKPMPSQLSLEYAKTSMVLNTKQLLEGALRGEVYLGNKTIMEHLDKNYYNVPMKKGIEKKLRQAGRLGTKFIMGNPIKLISRMERFTFTDTMMGTLANKRTALFLARAKRELSQAISSNGRATTNELREYQARRGSIVGTDKDLDWFTRQESSGGNVFKRKGAGEAIWDEGLKALNMQHDLVRYAIFLATLDDVQRTGSIKSYGAAWGFKDVLDGMDTYDAAARIAFENIATFGDMPFVLRKLTPWLVFTSYLAGQTRWATNWGLSMKSAYNKMLRGEDVKQSAAHLTTPLLGVGSMYFLGNLLYSAIADAFGVDEETEEEWMKERPYIEMFSTLINGAPVPNSTPGMPAEALYEDYVKTIIKGFEEQGITGIPKAMIHKQLIARANPLIKIPVESATGKMYFTEFPIDDKYHTNFIDNILRKVSGTMVGAQTVNAMIDSQKLAQYRDEEKGFMYDIISGMKNAISSEFGNSRSYKRDLKDFYTARGLIYGELYGGDNDYGYSSGNYYSNNGYDQEEADRIGELFRTALKRNEPVSTVYNILYDELDQGASPSTLHAALNKISVLRVMNRLENKSEFIASLSEKERQILQNAIRFEEEMFPGISNVDLYSLTGSGYQPDYIPYNQSSYLPYENNYKPYRPKYDPKIYPSMGGYYNPYEQGGFYNRWKPKPKWNNEE